jgi:hypothetical protein
MCASEERRAICIPWRMMDLVNDVWWGVVQVKGCGVRRKSE